MIRISNRLHLAAAAIVITCTALPLSPALAQMSPEEHAKHPPGQAQGGGEKGGGMVGGEGSGMMGGGIGGGMEKQSFQCHQTTSWNDILAAGWYKHH